jgi:hypothetical protein
MKPTSHPDGDEPRVLQPIVLPTSAIQQIPGLADNPTVVLDLTPSTAALLAMTPEQREQRFRATLEQLGQLAGANAFRPAKELICKQYPDIKAIHKVLRQNPQISWRRPPGKNGMPVMNRLEIHVGQWFAATRCLPAGLTGDPLDSPAELVDEVFAIERRKAEERQASEMRKRNGPGK